MPAGLPEQKWAAVVVGVVVDAVLVDGVDAVLAEAVDAVLVDVVAVDEVVE